jgi:hypothetical protein
MCIYVGICVYMYICTYFDGGRNLKLCFNFVWCIFRPSPETIMLTYVVLHCNFRPHYIEERWTNLTNYFLKYFFVANAFISFNTQTMHIKSFFTQQHCYVSLKTLYPGGIPTWVFSFLRRMRCPMHYATRAT